MSARSKARGVVAAGCIALLAGCGSSANERSGGDEEEESPLTAIFGGNQSEAEMRAQQLRLEELVAACMQEQGWEYTPVDWAAQSVGDEAGAEDAALSPQEYGEKYGYGVMRNYELYELPYLLGEGEQDPDVNSPEFTDPNGDYAMSLSPSEQEEYYASLYGEPVEATADDVATEDTEWVSPPLEEQGCYGQSQLEVYGDEPWSDPDFQLRMEELWEDQANDAGVKAAEREWVACMAAANDGWELAGPNDTWSHFERRKAELGGQEVTFSEVDPDTGMPLDESLDLGDGYVQSVDSNGMGMIVSGEQEALTEAEIEELRSEEIEMWTADQDCQDESGYRQAQRDAEQKMADVITEEFPQYVDDRTDTTDAGS